MKALKRKDYEARLKPLQLELAAMARWASHCGARIVVVMEGRDTAGKGGAIGAITEHLNPRQCRVVALPKVWRPRSSRFSSRYMVASWGTLMFCSSAFQRTSWISRERVPVDFNS